MNTFNERVKEVVKSNASTHTSSSSLPFNVMRLQDFRNGPHSLYQTPPPTLSVCHTSSSLLTFNVMRLQDFRNGPHYLYWTEAMLDGCQLSKWQLIIWQFFHFHLPNTLPEILAKILDNTDPLFALVITSGVYLHHVDSKGGGIRRS